MSVELITKLRGTCVGGEGPNLSRFPNLCHSHEKGVFTHLAGKPIEDIVRYVSVTEHNDTMSVVELLDDCAGDLGVTFDELLDALRYARANKLI